jgi:hypothetical protein
MAPALSKFKNSQATRFGHQGRIYAICLRKIFVCHNGIGIFLVDAKIRLRDTPVVPRYDVAFHDEEKTSFA